MSKPARKRPATTRELFAAEVRRLAALPGARQAWLSVQVRIGGHVSTYRTPVPRDELKRIAADMETE